MLRNQQDVIEARRLNELAMEGEIASLLVTRSRVRETLGGIGLDRPTGGIGRRTLRAKAGYRTQEPYTSHSRRRLGVA